MKTPITVEEAKNNYLKSAAKLNLPEDGVGKTVTFQDEQFEVLGMGKRIRRNPLVLKNLQTGELQRGPATLLGGVDLTTDPSNPTE